MIKYHFVRRNSGYVMRAGKKTSQLWPGELEVQSLGTLVASAPVKDTLEANRRIEMTTSCPGHALPVLRFQSTSLPIWSLHHPVCR